MRTWVIIDCNYLAYRAFHTTGHLHYNQTQTGVIYGTLGEILQLESRFGPCSFVFTSDRSPLLRELSCPEYKAKRKERQKNQTKKEKKKYKKLHQQIRALRKRHLKEIGFKNVFSQKGYEADDLIASICKNSLNGSRAIIVTADSDLFQLLSKKVQIWNPTKKKLWTKKNFKKEFGVTPKEWVQVKAIAGCGTDEIGGIKGVGVKTAIKHIRGELKIGSKKWKAICNGVGVQQRSRNIPLVALPFKGCKTFKLKRDKNLNWKPTLAELNIKSLKPGLVYREKL